MTSALHDYIKREGIVNSVSIKRRGPGAGMLEPVAGESHSGAAGVAAGFGWAELLRWPGLRRLQLLVGGKQGSH